MVSYPFVGFGRIIYQRPDPSADHHLAGRCSRHTPRNILATHCMGGKTTDDN